MRRGRGVAAGAVTGMVAVALAAGPAGAAKTVTVPSSITTSAYGYFGKVKSSKGACVSARKVVLKQKGHGALASAVSDEQGNWKVDPSELHFKGPLPYKIYAVLQPRSEGTAGTVYKCLGATGKTITINGG
jgi:hypothetical protein